MNIKKNICTCMYIYIFYNKNDIKRGHDQVILHQNQSIQHTYLHMYTYVMNMI